MANPYAVEEYFQNTIKKSWTWERLTEYEKKLFIDLDFDCIKGTDKQRIRWFLSMYHAFLAGCGYKDFSWRDINEKPLF